MVTIAVPIAQRPGQRAFRARSPLRQRRSRHSIRYSPPSPISRLTTNAAGNAADEVRTAGVRKDWPNAMTNAKPPMMNAAITTSFVPVRTFWMRATRFTPEQIDYRKQSDQSGSSELRHAQMWKPKAVAAAAAWTPDAMPRIVGEGQRSSRDGRGEACEEGNPSAHKAPCGTESVGEVNVLAARTGEVHAQFGIADGTANANTAPMTHTARISAGIAQVRPPETPWW